MVKDLTGILRDAYGIRTPAQELGEKLALERIGQVRAQSAQARAQTAQIKARTEQLQREQQERETGNEVTVHMEAGEEAFME